MDGTNSKVVKLQEAKFEGFPIASHDYLTTFRGTGLPLVIDNGKSEFLQVNMLRILAIPRWLGFGRGSTTYAKRDKKHANFA